MLSNKQQRIKINNVLSSWKNLIQGVIQGFILGLVLFKMYLNDLFSHKRYRYSLQKVLNSLEKNSELKEAF